MDVTIAVAEWFPAMRALRPQTDMPAIRRPDRPFAPPTGTRAAPRRRNRRGSIALLATMLLAAALAGCSENAADNKAPNAELTANKETGWTTEEFVFDGRDSSDSDGTIVSWRFDFGDGTTAQASREEDARVSHRFLHGGEFAVTLTVTDDGRENEGALPDTDTVQVRVDERIAVAAAALYAVPANQSVVAKREQSFQVYEGANRFEMNLTATSLLLAGSSEISIKVLDPTGATLDAETLTVQAGQTGTATLDSLLTKQGAHKVVIEAMSGGARVQGELRLYYA